MKLGILGGGQLGMMMCQAAKSIDISTIIYSDSLDSPAINFSDSHFIDKYDNFLKIDEFVDKCDVITYEFENIPYETLKYIKSKINVFPSPEVNNIIQDRLSEKNYIDSLKIPAVPFVKINNQSDLDSASNDYFPAILKTRKLGYDGKGQQVINEKKDILEIASGQYILEKKIKLKQEISVITVRYQNGNMYSYTPIDNAHKNQILNKSISPAIISKTIEQKSLEWSKKIISNLDYIGVICVEYFISEEDELFVNEIAPRVHNSGHLTIESYNISQFESHVRAVCNIDSIEPKMMHSSEMENILGEDIFKYRMKEIEQNSYFHDYFKEEAKTGRKMGHITKILI
ncbi:5-(carboxyamino)imidazole ribonucleotide synthase [Alphaproteobacteria bacterium]|nr:5-(carboxyamino)imidazole ribonucleotide synthase [Alphaproteobacteria bacterium]